MLCLKRDGKNSMAAARSCRSANPSGRSPRDIVETYLLSVCAVGMQQCLVSQAENDCRRLAVSSVGNALGRNFPVLLPKFQSRYINSIEGRVATHCSCPLRSSLGGRLRTSKPMGPLGSWREDTRLFLFYAAELPPGGIHGWCSGCSGGQKSSCRFFSCRKGFPVRLCSFHLTFWHLANQFDSALADWGRNWRCVHVFYSF